ncbi:MAG: DUF5916 domain-containing protein [Lewinella sp.]|jgi:hypothetical protein|nr:DUF5916 domain-containing protein [Lewinella sp.]
MKLPILLLLLAFSTCIVAQSTLFYEITSATGEITIDGIPNEAAWATATIATDFQLTQPTDGKPASERTEVKMLFDDRFLYVSATLYEKQGIVAQTLKRDDPGSSDHFVVWLDPVGERTNGYAFGLTPVNAQTEVLTSTDDLDAGWDNRWYSETNVSADRWTLEMAIPFKSVRYAADGKSWRFNLARVDAGANETSVWSPVPRQFNQQDFGYYGELRWPTPPGKAGGNVSFIPYVRAGLDQNQNTDPTTATEVKLGADAKIALSPTLNLDLTYNPDFSQVEVDQQVTNLTRFSIFFPERRQFFLENSDIFSSFGQFANSPFYSRRIGLDANGSAVPILYGLRLSGNVGGKSRIGLLNVHTGEGSSGTSAQNYTAVAGQRRFWKRSSVKGIFVNRQGFDGTDAIDGDYSRNFGGEINLSTEDGKWSGSGGYLQSAKPGVSGDDGHAYGSFIYQGTRFQATSFLQRVGTNYFADVGFNNRVNNFDPVRGEVVRIGYTQFSNNLDYYIYPKASEKVNFHWSGMENYLYWNAEGYGFNERYTRLRHFIFFKNTSQLRFRFNNQFVDLNFPFSLTGTPLPEGEYNFSEFNIQFNTDQRKTFQTEWFVVYGEFYNGKKLTYRGSVSYLAPPWGTFSLGIERNEIRLPDPFGDLNLTLATGRAEVNFSTKVFWTTFLQYNTQADNFNINSRLQYRFAPMSDVFLVYSDNYRVENVFEAKTRQLILKVNYWFTP